MARSKYDKASEKTLSHGLYLQEQASEMYADLGIYHDDSRFDLVDGLVSYGVRIGTDYARSWGEVLGDNVSNWWQRTLGQRAIRGSYMYVNETDLEAEPRSVLVSRNRYSHPDRSRYFTSVSQLGGYTSEGVPLSKRIDNPEVGLDFCERFVELTPENIIIEQRNELSDTESYEHYAKSVNNFAKIADALGVSVEQMSASYYAACFSLGDDIIAEIDYRSPILQNFLTKEAVDSGMLTMHVRNYNSDKYVALTASYMPIGPLSPYLVKACSGESGQTSSDAVELPREDILAMSRVLDDLAAQPEHAVLSRRFASGSFGANQPEVRLQQDDYQRIHSLLKYI